MSLESLIDDSGQFATITVEAASGSFPPQTSLGGVDRSQAWPIVAANVPCLLSNRSSPLMSFPGRNDARAQVYDTRVYFYFDPTPSGFTTRMRINVTKAGPGGDAIDLGTYSVKGTNNPNTMGVIFQVDCEKVRTP
jgi:hypothetical protein